LQRWSRGGWHSQTGGSDAIERFGLTGDALKREIIFWGKSSEGRSSWEGTKKMEEGGERQESSRIALTTMSMTSGSRQIKTQGPEVKLYVLLSDKKKRGIQGPRIPISKRGGAVITKRVCDNSLGWNSNPKEKEGVWEY